MPLISSHYVQQCQLVIDVGGTNIDIYGKNQTLSYELIDSLQSPTSQSDFYLIIDTILNKYRPLFPILGLPGPVASNSSAVFCPPLDFSLDISLIHEKYPDLLIINDTECLSYIIVHKSLNAASSNRADHLSSNGITCTLGTSFGLASFNYFDEVGSVLVESFEFAHIPLILTSRLSRVLNCTQSPAFKSFNATHLYSQVLSGNGFRELTSSPEFTLLMSRLYSIIPVCSELDAYSLLICELLVPICQLFAPRSISFVLHGGVLNSLDRDKLSTFFNHAFTANNLENVSLEYSCIK